MAQTLCQLKKKGGGQLKETVLWTNSNPSSDFSYSDVNVSDISNYDYIKITYYASKVSSIEASVIMSLDEFLECKESSTNSSNPILAISTRNNTINYMRAVYYKTNTKITFGASHEQTATYGTYNNYCIPVTIKGLKF